MFCRKPLMYVVGALGLGGIDYLLQCIVESEENSAAIQWQGLLGRLYMLDQLIQERGVDFKATQRIDGSSPAHVTTEPHGCYSRTILVLRFVARHISFPHAKAAKLAHCVFCRAATLQVAVGGMAIVEQACSLLDSVDSHIQMRIRRKLQSVAGDYSSDKAASSMSAELMPSANVDPVVFFVSAQPAPKMEVVSDTSDHADGASISESTSEQLQSAVCNTNILPRTDKETDDDAIEAAAVEAELASEKRFIYKDAVIVSKQVTVVDSCIQTSPYLLRRKKIARAASSLDDNSDIEPSTTSRTERQYGFDASDSAEFLDSHGSASSSHGSASGTTDDLIMDITHASRTAIEKVLFKKEVAWSQNDSFERNEGMTY